MKKLISIVLVLAVLLMTYSTALADNQPSHMDNGRPEGLPPDEPGGEKPDAPDRRDLSLARPVEQPAH